MIKMWLHSVYPTVTGYNIQVSFFSPFFRLPPQICQLAVIVHISQCQLVLVLGPLLVLLRLVKVSEIRTSSHHAFSGFTPQLCGDCCVRG